MNERLKAKIEEAANAFREAGMSDLPYVNNVNGGTHLYLKGTARTTYPGTYLNQFSVIDGKVDPCPLRTDEIATEKAEAVIEPVYRHNGSAEDVSIGIWFYPWHASVRPWPQKFQYEIENKPAYAQYVKEHAPFNYLDHPETFVFSSGCSKGERTAKFSKTAGKRAIANAVEKTMSLVRAFVPSTIRNGPRTPRTTAPTRQANTTSGCWPAVRTGGRLREERTAL